MVERLGPGSVVSVGRRVLFALLTVLFLLALLEAGARAVWNRLAAQARAERQARGEEVLRNDAIHYLKQPDGVYGYVLKPDTAFGRHYTNPQGFAQRETVLVARKPGALRVVAMGESTTQGHDVDSGNYPRWLAERIRRSGSYDDVEMINAGVAGWISDHLALRAERELAAYRPDLVVLYLGWNDFQSYDPLRPAPERSYFETAYGSEAFHALSVSKLVLLTDALVQKLRNEARARWFAERQQPVDHARSPLGELSPAEENYRFFLRSLDRIVAAYRKENPQVVIAISTLVGRWPLGGAKAYEATNGRTWWMQEHGLSPERAAEFLERFDALIAGYARSHHGLVLIDAAAAFDDLDRARLQRDFAHMSDEGYELLAETMYESLRAAGALRGQRSERLEELRARYADEAGAEPGDSG